jgi:hypothetical protein
LKMPVLRFKGINEKKRYNALCACFYGIKLPNALHYDALFFSNTCFHLSIHRTITHYGRFGVV